MKIRIRMDGHSKKCYNTAFNTFFNENPLEVHISFNTCPSLIFMSKKVHDISKLVKNHY